MSQAGQLSAQEYLDFDLEIGLGDGRSYPVAVLDSPSGETRGVMHFPYDEINLRLHLVELENVLLRSATTHRVASDDSEKTVEQFGSKLFAALFDDEVRNRYEVSLERARMQGKGLRIKLRILAPELAALPWEFLYDANRSEYLVFSRQTPIVRYPALPIPLQPMEVTPPLRILGMVASPRGLPELDVRSEKERLSQPLEKLQQAGLIELHWLEGQTWRDLQRAMRQGPWHVFHFIGHGGFDAQRDEGFFALSGEDGERVDLRATQLARLIADHTALRLVVLNACEGARSSREDVFSSSASILLRGGVPAVLAMQYAITDRAAVEFARTFYEALADGIPVDTAVAEGRVAISLAFADTIEWGTPVLYLRAENGALFDIHKLKLPSQSVNNSLSMPEAQASRLPAPNRPEGAIPSEALIEQPAEILSLRGYLSRIERTWWIAGGVGLLLLCILLTVISGLPRSALALLILQPTVTLTAPPEVASPSVVLEPTLTATLTQPTETPTATLVIETATWTPPAPSQTPTVMPLSVTLTSENSTGSAILDLQPGATQISPKDGMVMVYIPAGEFQMGCDPNNNAGFPCGADELLHLLYLDAYWVDQTHVTNAMYAQCVAEGACEPPIAASSQTRSSYYNDPEYADFPVVYVSWDKAVAYCAWAGRRLPTEAEWEKAGRGESDTRAYPWGNELPTCDVANFKSGGLCVGDTSPAGGYPGGASPYGVLDMAGNVWDWVSDFYDENYYMTSPKINPLGPQTGMNKVIRGACWVNNPNQLRVANRFYAAGFLNYDDISFRCAASP